MADARGGDAKAREWLTQYLVGKPDKEALRLSKLAAEEETGVDPLAGDVSHASMMAATAGF